MKKEQYMNSVREFVTEGRDIGIIHQDTSDGFMELTGYYILPGIYLVLNDIHTQIVPLNAQQSQKILIVNYCMEGRCEFRVNEDNYSYLDHRMMSISSRMAENQFYYPSSCYKGYEIYVLPEWFTEKTKDFLKSFDIDMDMLIALYEKGAALYVTEPFLKLWNDLADCCPTENIGQIRLLTLQLLKSFCDHKPENNRNMLYLSRVQVMLAKKAQEILTRDLSRHISMKSIADTLGVSETSLKRYFHSVYGANLSTYMNEVRMKYAAELLTTSKLGISDIAKACGYVNQGRFATVFRDFHGMKPLDYRRNHALTF